jgi:hypothetical protein
VSGASEGVGTRSCTCIEDHQVMDQQWIWIVKEMTRSSIECVHLSKNNLSINSINFDIFFDRVDKFDKYDIFPKSNYYDDILVKFSKNLIFLVQSCN